MANAFTAEGGKTTGFKYTVPKKAQNSRVTLGMVISVRLTILFYPPYHQKLTPYA
jgi:hypothetical protein